MGNQFEALAYEEALSELESIVNQLRDGQASLEEMVSLYEKGSELYKLCYSKLEEAKQRVLIYDKQNNNFEVFKGD